LDESKLEALEEISGDSAKAQAVLDASRLSMGMDISPIRVSEVSLITLIVLLR
jgi:nucleolar protein 56